MKKNREIKGADAAIADAKRSAFEHGHREGYGQALKVCKITRNPARCDGVTYCPIAYNYIKYYENE